MSETAILLHQGTPKHSYHATIVCLMKNKYSKTCCVAHTDTDDPALLAASVTSTSEMYVAVTLKY
jgi:hypothetical protein